MCNTGFQGDTTKFRRHCAYCPLQLSAAPCVLIPLHSLLAESGALRRSPLSGWGPHVACGVGVQITLRGFIAQSWQSRGAVPVRSFLGLGETRGAFVVVSFALE